MSQRERSSPSSGRVRRAAPPLDAAALERLALRYVERFATTRARLATYLLRKIRERGWDGAPGDPHALAERFAELGYIDDKAFGEARAAAMARRGLGERRVAMSLRQDGIGEADSADILPAAAARRGETAIAFARRKRIGPYAAMPADRPQREKHIAAMIRAGHDFTVARKIAMMMPGDDVADLLEA